MTSCASCNCTSDSSSASTMYKGDHRTFRLTVRDQDSNLVDLTGAVLVFTVKTFPTDATAAIQKSSTVSGEIDITDAVNGEAEINILPVDTDPLGKGVYVFDVQLTTASGKVHTLLTGTLELLQDITN